MLVLILLILTVLTSILLATTLLTALSGGRLNRYLATMTLFISVWALGDILMLYAHNLPLVHLGAILFYVGPMITTLFVLFFADSSPEGIAPKKSLVWPTCLLTVVLGGIILVHPDFIVGAIHLGRGARNIIVPRKIPLNIYSLYFNIFFVITYAKLIVRYRRSKGLFKSQLLLTLIGITITSALAFTTNLLLPQFGVYDTVWMGPIFTLFFASTIIVAIVKHRYLNVRLFAARTTAYLLGLGSFVSLYAGLLYAVSRVLLFSGLNFTNNQFVSVAVAILLAFTFQPLKKFFDRITNRLFYRDAYDPQEFFDQLNRVLVSTTGLEELLGRTLGLVEGNLKTEYALLNLKATNHNSLRTISRGDKELVQQAAAILQMHHSTAHPHGAVISVDHVNVEDKLLEQLLIKHNVAVIARLGSVKDEPIGYFILGPKKSRNPYSGQDIRVIKTMANELTVAIQNALRYEQIENFNTELRGKIEKATRQLRRANDRLRALDETKDDFVSMASHQLRTPLTSVKGYVSMVLDGDAGKITSLQRQLLSQSFSSAQRMVYLISDLLNLSRLKTGKFVITRSPTNLVDVVQDELSQFQSSAAEHQVAISFTPPAHFPILALDETKTRQVIMNFIDNAIYYTPSSGHIEVRLVDKPDCVEFSVVDDGIGVPAAERHHLFTKFYRASNARKTRPDGTGLGLFMAKKVIAAQGGAIIFSSREAQGSTFGFSFPKK